MLLRVGGLALFISICLLRPVPATAQAPDAETKAKVDALKKQVEDLQKKIESLQSQEKALLQAVERKAQEKDYFNKIQVEVKGRLERSGKGKNAWTVTAKDATWHLAFGDNKDLADLAKSLEGKTVLVTGAGTITSTSNFSPVQQSYGPAPGLGGYGGGGFGGYGGGGFGGMNTLYAPVTTTTLTLTVETLKAP
jgi:TolA-binding protein